MLVFLPAVLQAAVVAAFGTRMLLWDEFVYVDAFREIGEGRPWLHWIWQQHNEHRIVWTKLLFFAHAPFSGWNPLVDMYASALLTALIAWGIWKLYRAAGPGRPAYFVPAALLLCTLAQYMNILYGMMTCHYFTIAGLVWTIVFLMRGTRGGLAAAIACAFAALVSTLNAVVIAPIGLLVLVMTRQKPVRWLVWTGAMLACGAVYLYGYQRPPQIPTIDWTSASGVRQLADTFILNLGSPLFADGPGGARVLGVITVAALVLLWVSVWVFERRESHAGLVALGCIAVGCAAAVAVGRSALGPATALESKYVAYSTLAIVAVHLGFVSLPGLRWHRGISAALSALLALGWTATNVARFEQVRSWQRDRHRAAYLLETFEMQPDENLGSIFDVPRVRADAAYLRATRLGPFRETVDALMPPRWREGLPTGPITAASPVKAHLVCPVDTLVDVGLVVSPAGGPGAVEVTVTVGGRIVGRGVLAAERAKPAGYVRVNLDSPVRGCRGADLIVEATSGTADSAGAFHAWTYPVYVAGVTRQGGRLIERRSLGITFNAFSYRLID